MPHYTAIVTLLAVALYFFLATRVAVPRGKFDAQRHCHGNRVWLAGLRPARLTT
jgi:hypothetical protein